MFVVVRTFRDANGVFKVGSVVEPTDVKAFRSRLQQKHIVDVDEHNIDNWVQFFKARFGIDLTDKLAGHTNSGIVKPVDASLEEAHAVGAPPVDIELESIETSAEVPDNISEQTANSNEAW